MSISLYSYDKTRLLRQLGSMGIWELIFYNINCFPILDIKKLN